MTSTVHSTVEQVSIRPYARLLTMLGEQLIKNDRIALVELLKNCYDADASVAKVTFANFTEDLRVSKASSLIVVDDGEGMNETIVREHWLNPATAIKAKSKQASPKTKKNRIIQGEKGIGRFAIFKLGSVASITTRAYGADLEFVLDYDLEFLDNEGHNLTQLDDTDTSPEFLDEIPITLTQRPPLVFDGSNPDGLESNHGTRIEIMNLRSPWSETIAESVFEDVVRLQPLVPSREFELPGVGEEFKVEFWKGDDELPFQSAYKERLLALFEHRAVLRVNGVFDSDAGEFDIEVNGAQQLLRMDDPLLKALQVHKNYFGSPKGSPRGSEDLACGSFFFSFFIFDLSGTCPEQHRLDSEENGIVKDHRIYLYRDGIRVLPYGDPEDDWLQLDVIRGTQAARRVLSNQQTVGFVHITQAENPTLRDKTNREGLLDDGDAYTDFKAILQTIIAYLRAHPYQQYLIDNQRREKASERAKTDIAAALNDLERDPTLPKPLKKSVQKLTRSYEIERTYLETRADRTEDLAGVGLSVETASHDIVAAGGRALETGRAMLKYIESRFSSSAYLKRQIESLIELVGFIVSRLNDVQGLFVSTRQRRKVVDATKFADRIGRLFHFALAENNIRFRVTQSDGPLKVKITEAALLQALLNLVDNAIYWLNTVDQERRIVIEIQANERQIVVADNGPGVHIDDEPYIFEPFYSSKGDEGKGLGLYIARQVGIRHGFDVTLSQEPLVLGGANFVLSFDEVEA